MPWILRENGDAHMVVVWVDEWVDGEMGCRP